MLSSSSQNSSRSVTVMSARLPSEAKVETPIPLSSANSISASPRAPLWVAKATLPATGSSGAKLTLSPSSGSVSRRPRQLGPISLIPASRQTARSSRSRSAPSSPTSVKPAERTTRLLAPLATHSRAVSATASALTAITARSTSSGMSETLANAGTDWTLSADGLTG